MPCLTTLTTRILLASPVTTLSLFLFVVLALLRGYCWEDDDEEGNRHINDSAISELQQHDMPFFRRRRTRVRAGSVVRDDIEQTKKARRWSFRYMMKWPEAVEREILDLKLSSTEATEDVPTPPIDVAVSNSSDHRLRHVESSKLQAGTRPDGCDRAAARQSIAERVVENTRTIDEPRGETPVDLQKADDQETNDQEADEQEVAAAFDGAFHVPLDSDATYTVQDYTPPKIEAFEGAFNRPAVVPMPGLRMRGLYAGSVSLEYFEHIQAEARATDGDDARQDLATLDDLELLARAPESFGLRPLDSQYIVDRLIELSKFYQEWKPRQGGDWWAGHQKDLDQSNTALFAKILLPPSDAADTRVLTSRSQAIQALVRVLSTASPWYNLSIETNRILIGQILFDQQGHDEVDEATSPALPTLAGRDVVLLQILLACELYLRAKPYVEKESSSGPPNHKPWNFTEDVTFDSESSRAKVHWDLAMADVFLENMQPLARIQRVPKQSTLDKAKRLFFPASFATPGEVTYEEKPDILLLPRHQERQIDGLKQFSRDIGWPEPDVLEQTLAQKFPPLSQERKSYGSLRRMSTYGTPALSVGSHYAQEATDYFTSRARPSLERHRSRPPIRPQMSRERKSQVSFQLSSPSPLGTPSQWSKEQPVSPTGPQQLIGWLTCTYLTGLILPGESLQHLLISCMLENSPEAMLSLGETATLLGGFVFDRRSYWSSQCIVGRVLAGLRRSSEGWGWMGTNCVPTMASSYGGSSRASSDGWIEVVAEDVVHPTVPDRDIIQNFQIHAPADIPDEYVVPLDSLQKPSNLLWFEGLHLTSGSEEVPLIRELDQGPATCTAAVNFSSASLSSEIGSARFHLKHDVYFISATSCQPPSMEALLRLKLVTPTEGGTGRERGAHPLHKSQRYGTVSAVEVVKRDFTPPETGHTLILDARGSETLELLARAWCASVGRHAIVGSEDDTCVACCVRKAKHAGVSIVIRI